MRSASFPRLAQALSFFLCIVQLCLLLSPARALGNASFPGLSYCSSPTMPGSGVKPNLLLMLDNSASMYDLAYTDPATFCIDASYDNRNSYSGYFEQDSVYSYDGTKFAPGAALPSTGSCSAPCVVSTNFLHLEMAGAVSPASHRTVSGFKASGNFLNWLSMSKLDIEKKVLTGGKYVFANSTSQQRLLQGETRGCQGKRFVKIVPGESHITFAVRGPASTDPGYSAALSGAGVSTIEIYDKAYKVESCVKAIDAWRRSHRESMIAETNACMGLPPEANPISEQQILHRIMSHCHFFLAYKQMPFDALLNSDCLAHYLDVFGPGFDLLTVDWSRIHGVCARQATHTPRAGPGSDDSGFVGKCATKGVGCTQPSGFTSGICFGVGCARSEMLDYCNEIRSATQTDPSASVIMGGSSASLPGFVIDAGIAYLGPVAGAFHARVRVDSAPTGIVQQFGNSINMGAMVFNADGASGTECAADRLSCPKRCRFDAGLSCSNNSDCKVDYGPCDTDRCRLKTSLACARNSDCADRCEAGRDGGRIVSYINDPLSPLGDHATGLIAAIDQVAGTTWTPLAESLYNAAGYFANLEGLRLQDDDFDAARKPSRFSCQKNNVLIVSDGISTADRHPDVAQMVAKAVRDWAGGAGPESMPGSATTNENDTSPAFQGSYNLDDLAWIARHKNVSNFSQGIPNNRDYLSTYVIYTGVPCGDYHADGSCKTTDEGVPEKMLQLAAAKGGGKFARARHPVDLEKAFRVMLQQIAGGSGTDAAILSTGEGNGAIFLQEEFYPEKSFDGGRTSASWIGEMQSLWYYIDPFLSGTLGAGSTIREDSTKLPAGAKLQLDLRSDLVVTLGFDAAGNQTRAYLLKDSDGNGLGDAIPPHEERFLTDMPAKVATEELNSLWRAGRKLWLTEPSRRRIYTQLDGLSLCDFTSAALNTVMPEVQRLFQAGSQAEADAVVEYVRGSDSADFRERSVAIPGQNGGGSSVWKLGDIVSSTPQVQSSAALGGYHLAPPRGYGDASYLRFVKTERYRSRGAVYVGANDGMLHAFNLGKLDTGSHASVKATLDPGDRDDLGQELWAFVPRHALPYLTYLKEPGYQHLYYVDGGVTLADASIGDIAGTCGGQRYWSCPKTVLVPGTRYIDTDPAKNSWRTVLIGGMGLGGATCASGVDCVPTPLADPADPRARLGYSSYFALDVTDHETPKLLWEFANPDLGYSTSGPAIVRVGDPGLNGRWFAVFGSGPTGPIDTAGRRFMGGSNQTLKFFVVDLRSGALVTTIDTDIKNAFAGSMTGGAIDADRWHQSSPGKYQDDAIYVGYTMKSPVTGAWTDGGVLRIVTNESDLNDGSKPWTWSGVIDGVGPVTSAVSRLQDRANVNLWLYFGTGRYFHTQDDMQGLRALYGVKEPCYNVKIGEVDRKLNKLEPTCAAFVLPSRLANQTLDPRELGANDPGWLIDLDPATDAAGAERLVANPTSATSGAVFFSTFQPSKDLCHFGYSYLWGVRYNTGRAMGDGVVQGKVLVQLATGSLQETGLSAGNFGDKIGRRGAAMTGKPGGLKIVSNSGLTPLRRVIHIQER